MMMDIAEQSTNVVYCIMLSSGRELAYCPTLIKLLSLFSTNDLSIDMVNLRLRQITAGRSTYVRDVRSCTAI